MEIGKELVSEPRDVVGSIENFVVVSLVVGLLLGAEGPDRSRNQSSKVLWLFSSLRIGSLDGCTEAVPSPLVVLLVIDDILVIFRIKQRGVFVAMIVFMDVGLIRVHLPQSLCWRLGSVCKEGPEVVVLLCKVPLPLATFVSTELRQPLANHSVGCAEAELLIPSKLVDRDVEMLLLHQEVKDLAPSNPLSVHVTAWDEILHFDLHRHCPWNTSLLCRGIAIARYLDRSIVQVPSNDLAVGIMSNME
jgi:hypothetical protein